ncbi:MIC60 MICOS complex subunit MIC60 [Candida maltosa Xu316]|uniref:MICOS complex subunit MIC60 n=1 Tax=Candida maltosa (strain Xu316) TaxID=1245528 RepID=M3IQC5_CANMX|nr:hypothetical protein G210_0735 [Candida maltosa Xu316]
MIRNAAVRRSTAIRSISTTGIRFNIPPVPPKVVSVPPTPPKVNPPKREGELPPPPTPKVVPPKKKRFSLFGFLFKTTLLAALIYGGTLYTATKNDQVMDFVIDNQLPYHEELIDLIENGSIEDLQQAWEELKGKFTDVKLPSKEDIEELTEKLETRGEDFLKETKKKLGQRKTGTDLTPTEQLQKNVEIEHVKKNIPHLPLIELSSSLGASVDETVRKTIDSFNDFIQSIDASTLASKDNAAINDITGSINALATKLNSLTKSFDEELQKKLKVSQTELFSSFTKKELELTENLLHQFTTEKQQLEAKLNEKLALEIQAARNVISQAATNAVSMVRIEQTKNFEKLIAERLNEERNGRLANLEKLSDRIDELEKFAESFESQIVSNHKKALIQQSVSKLKSLLLAPTANESPKAIKPYVDELNQIAADDEVLKLALKDLTPLLTNESTHSILTNAQLLSRWEQLAPELRSASLLPPNAGLLGHLASIVFSKLLLPVKGVKENGKDIESVIGRVESSLARGELDVAVEEVANLKGWSRKLANDWVVEGRKRLEVEFLLNLIESESKII